MNEQPIILPKQRLLVGWKMWAIVLGGALLILGTLVQVRMTWSRERVRNVTSDAQDALQAARSGASISTHQSNPFQPLVDLFQNFSETSSQ